MKIAYYICDVVNLEGGRLNLAIKPGLAGSIEIQRGIFALYGKDPDITMLLDTIR